MNVDQAEQLRTQKTQIREQAHANRKAQENKDAEPASICESSWRCPNTPRPGP